MKKQFGYIISAFVISIVLAIFFLWTSLPHFTTMFIGDGGDNYEYAAYMGYAAQEVSNGRFPLTHMNFWRYPVGIDFQRSFDSYLTLSIGTFWVLLFKLPLGYNLTVLTLLALNGICSFILFRRITKSYLLGIVGMVVYGFSVYPLAKSSAHLNLLFIGGLPLFLFFVINLFSEEKPTAKAYFFLGLCVLLIAMGSLQYLAMLIIFVIIGLPVLFYFYRPLWNLSVAKVTHTIPQLLLGGGSAFMLFLVLFHPHLTAMLTGKFQFVGREGTLFTSTPAVTNFFLPNPYLDILSTKLKAASVTPSIEFAVFLGWIEMVVFLGFLSIKTLHKRFRLFLFVLFLIPFLFALGYGKENMFPLLPYRFLSEVPLFKIIAEPGRYFVIFYLFVTMGIVLFFKHLPQKKGIRSALIGIFLLLVLIQRFPTQTKLSPTLANQPYVSIVAKTDTKAVLDFPVNIYYPRYNILSLYYKKPIVGGYFHWSADGPKEKEFLLQSSLLTRYSCSSVDPMLEDGMDAVEEEAADIRMLRILKKNGIKTIVLHKDDKFYHTVCKNLRLRLSRLAPYEKELKPTNTSTEVHGKAWDGKPAFTFYFPKSGDFFLDGLYISPASKATFLIKTSDGSTFDYSWKGVGSPYAFEIQPKNTIQMKVTAGATITVYSTDEIRDTFFSLWYRYTPDKESQTVPLRAPLQMLFEDANTTVYQL